MDIDGDDYENDDNDNDDEVITQPNSPRGGSSSSSAIATDNLELTSLYDILSKELNIIYGLVKSFPEPINEISKTASGTTLSLEESGTFKKAYFEHLTQVCEHMNKILECLYPIYCAWYINNTTLDSILDNMVNTGIDKDALLTFHVQSRCILAYMEEYFMLARQHMPSWRILGSSEDGDKSKTAMECAFFYQLCNIRVITDVLGRLKNYLIHGEQVTADNNRMTYLLSLQLVPTNLSKWKYPHVKHQPPKNKLMIPYYTQSQLETSLQTLFLKLNLVGYHSNLGTYIEELLFRMSWLFTCSHSGSIIDIQELRAPLSDNIMSDVGGNFLNNFALGKDLVGDEPMGISTNNDTEQQYICGIDYALRSILRYQELLAKLAFRSFIYQNERITTSNGHIKEMSAWLQARLNAKFDKTFTLMKSEVGAKYAELLLPPSDKQWVLYRHPLMYISDASIWSILYPNLKEFASQTAGKDPKTMYYKPLPTEAAIVEFIGIKLMHMIFSKFDFRRFFVKTQDVMLANLDNQKARLKMPILVQSFNRYCLLYQKPTSQVPILYEYGDIFDTLAAWLVIMLVDFSQDAVTHLIVSTIRLLDIETTKIEALANKGEPLKKTNEFSTMQTKLDDDENDDAGENGRRGFF